MAHLWLNNGQLKAQNPDILSDKSNIIAKSAKQCTILVTIIVHYLLRITDPER